MKMLLVDSDIIIEISRGNKKASVLLTRYKREYKLFVSAITRYEVIVGCRDKQEMRFLLELLETFETLPLNEEISQIADELIISYALSHNLKLADCLIASTAIYHSASLISRNQKDFRYIDSLKLLKYIE